ncbi:MAG: hypothetical protein V1788_00130 [Nanoarchaeota archaeon]
MIDLEFIIKNIDYISGAGIFGTGYILNNKSTMVVGGCAFIAGAITRILASKPDYPDNKDQNNYDGE